MPLRGTAGIVFDSGEIVTPVITEDALLSSAEFQAHFFLSGYFKDPDSVFIKIHMESGHASTSRYNITGQRLTLAVPLLERIKEKYPNIDDFLIILLKKEKMKTSDIRNNFHSLIDRIDNDPLLMKFYDLMIKSTTTKEGQLYKQLSEEQRKVLMLAEEESNDPANLISYDQQKKKHQKWL